MNKKKVTVKDMQGVLATNIKNYPLNFRPFAIISPYISCFFENYLPFITPNQISFIWGIIGFIGFYFMSLGGYMNMVLGILIYHFALLIDFVDGQLARFRKKTTLGGTYLDRFFTYVHRGLIVFALGIGVYNSTNQIMYLYIGLWSCFFLVFDNLNKLKVYETLINENKLKLLKDQWASYQSEGYQNYNGTFVQSAMSYVIELLRPNNSFSLLFWAVIFNFPAPFLILMAIVSPVFFFRNLVSIYKRIGNLPS